MGRRFCEKAAQGYYRPFVTRTPTLVLLLFITLALIALTEYACHSIPEHTGIGKLGGAVNSTVKRNVERELNKRQISSTALSSSPSSPTSSSSSSSGHQFSGICAVFLKGCVINTMPVGGWLSFGNGTYTSPSDPSSPTSTTITTPIGAPDTPPTSSSLAVAGDTRPLGILAASTPYIQPSPPPTAAIPEPTIAGFGSADLEGGTLTAPPPTPTIVAINGMISTETAVEPAATAEETPTPIVTVINGKATTLNGNPTVITLVSGGKSYTETLLYHSSSLSGNHPTVITLVSGGKSYTETLNYQSSSLSGSLPTGGSASSTTAAIQPTETIVNSTGTFVVWPDGNTSVAPQITLQQYVSVSFLPLIIAALYVIPFRILDSTIREMEPFYQLNQPGGSIAEYSLCLDYSTSFLFITPIKSGFRGHILVFWSSLISITGLVLAPISSETFFVSLSGSCGPNEPPCHANWGIYPSLARMLEGILAFITVSIVSLIIFGFRRKSGVYSEPLSIAGLATLFYESPLLEVFQGISSRASNSELRSILAGKRYCISAFESLDRIPCYGIYSAEENSETGLTSRVPAEKRRKNSLGSTDELPEHNFEIPRKNEIAEKKSGAWASIKEKLLYAVAFLILAGLLIIVIYYHWTSGNTGFERFMDSQGFGVRFMMSALGVVVGLFWSYIDQDFRKMEPYRRLLLGGVTAGDSILVPGWTSPFSAIIPSLRRGHFLVAQICFISVLSEFLPIILANIAFSPAMTEEAYFTCTYLAMIILILMLISITILIFRPRHHIRPLPRKPTTLASVLLYIANSGDFQEQCMLGSMQGLSILGQWERDECIKEFGSRYTMGLVASNDLHIDEDRRIEKLWKD